jgi:hypothetical protein
VQRAHLGIDIARRLSRRLAIRQHYIRDWLATFLDYAAIADRFKRARTAQLAQVGGARQHFYVVRMAEGERKQLMYDLAARIVDAEDLPVNLIIVSTWARSGWNVVKPNVLIDATATRDATAWQQLRGRAMRAHRYWTSACYQLTLLLLGSHALGFDELGDFPDDVIQVYRELTSHAHGVEALDAPARALLRDAHRAAGSAVDDPLAAKIERGALTDLSSGERRQLAIELMLARNKVTHVYELIRASGSSPQIRYDRAARRWTRSQAVAAKHAAEYAVNPLDGAYTAGSGHTPFIYAGDPRRDFPSALRQHLQAALTDADQRIVRGWLEAILDDAEAPE